MRLATKRGEGLALATLLALAALACSEAAEGGGETTPDPIALVVQGGAGTIRRADLGEELEGRYRAALSGALETGYAVLAGGGSSLDAVETTIRALEDDPLFNAGRGAVFTADGRNELDASIMDGSSLAAGAVAGVTRVRHPISAARRVMEATPHVLLAGPGAERFAAEEGLEMVEPGWFFTERRWQALLEKRRRAGEPLPEAPAAGGEELGTVGAVALDLEGRIAAGTSTGGMTNKRHGRVGDAPLIGAGTYADAGCGVSATGHGEFFIRLAVAYDICARARYLGVPVGEAAHEVIHEILVEAGGEGGVIALDAAGTPTLTFNTEGMYRGRMTAEGEPRVAIYGNDD